MEDTHQDRGRILRIQSSSKCHNALISLLPVAYIEHHSFAVWPSTFEVKSVKNWRSQTGFCTFVHCQKRPKCEGFCYGRRGTFEEDLERCCSRGRHSTRDMLIRDIRRSGHWFLERGCILEHRCRTSYDLLALLFRGRHRTLDRWSGKSANRIGTRPSALHSTSMFEGNLATLLRFWCCQLEKLRKSCRIASFLMLPS